MTENDGGKLNRLICAVARGETDSLDEIYSIAGGRMLAVALSVVGEKSAAEDVLQESFIKIVRFASKYRPSDSPFGWLMKIVRNTALDAVRKNRRHPTASAEEFYSLTSYDYAPERRENAIVLEQAISQLDEDEKKVIYFIYYLDMTLRETAAMMSCGKSTVQCIQERAEKKLKTTLSRGTNDGSETF